MKKANGITLVALVITIIILLILAGITISQLTGSGLFENAKLAEEKSKNAQEKEEGILGDYENQIGQYVNGSRDGVTLTQEQWQAVQDEISTLKTEVSVLKDNLEMKRTTLENDYIPSIDLVRTGNNKEIRMGGGNLKQNMTANTTYIIGTIPEEYRPIGPSVNKWEYINKDYSCSIIIEKDGTVKIKPAVNFTTSMGLYATISYI